MGNQDYFALEQGNYFEQAGHTPVEPVEGTPVEPVGGTPFEQSVGNPDLGTLEQNLDNPDSLVVSDMENFVVEGNPAIPGGIRERHQAGVLGIPLLAFLA